MRRKHTRAYEVTMVVHAGHDATIDTVKELLNDLSWVGGCRDPLSDPAFDSMTPSRIRIKRVKERDK